ncbi:hypothetical protein BO71DRAFT_350182 [Aspergillus ellipticus CBS 707.79]|uniref:Fatty acid hydroxylase domain-containing protein n=1 Tax=Aspergillus ellipticus CBS 707.79 TaxID=1448320 RepID=A0A319DF41_9EURO|nr:hypothetical protein BO71DRAFT_350182 [Aspergillus ellipticus CBS 707.79]
MASSIFAIPFFAIFVLPLIGSYGASFNLVFFYMTWTILIYSHSAFKIELGSTLTVRFFFYVIPSIVFFLFDIFMPSGSVMLKAQGEFGLPAKSKRSKIRRKEFKVAGWSLLNLVSGLALQALIEITRTSYFRCQSTMRLEFLVPMPWEIAVDLLLVIIAREVLAYVIHRYVLHSKHNRVTRRISHYHETWYHSLHAPYPLTAHYDHPLPYLIGTVIPVILPAAVSRLHLITYAVYMTVISLEETLTFSGYLGMPSLLFLGGVARRREMHLLSGAAGNFGPWGMMDWLFRSGVTELANGHAMGETGAVAQPAAPAADVPTVNGEVPNGITSRPSRRSQRLTTEASMRTRSMVVPGTEHIEERVDQVIAQHARRRQRQHRLRREVLSDD